LLTDRSSKKQEKRNVPTTHSLLEQGPSRPIREETKWLMDGSSIMTNGFLKRLQRTSEKSQSGATNTAEVPECRKGQLDCDLLRQIKVTKKRTIEGDALFFLQLLLPIGDPKKSGIENDPKTAALQQS
jgi:hypothetical protein